MSKPTTLKIDDVEYIRASDVPKLPPKGNRCVVVVDRGWIFAGDVERKEGRIRLTRAVHVRKWSGCWFDGMLKDPSKAQIAQLSHDVDMPEDAELFCVPVAEGWGL